MRQDVITAWVTTINPRINPPDVMPSVHTSIREKAAMLKKQAKLLSKQIGTGKQKFFGFRATGCLRIVLDACHFEQKGNAVQATLHCANMVAVGSTINNLSAAQPVESSNITCQLSAPRTTTPITRIETHFLQCLRSRRPVLFADLVAFSTMDALCVWSPRIISGTGFFTSFLNLFSA
jgi:hypothetical protein